MTTWLGMRGAAVVLAVIATMGGHAAQAQAQAATTLLNLSASGEVQAPPDMASLAVGVETTAATAAEAMRQNAAAMIRMLAAIKSAGPLPRDLRTSGLNLAPQYVYEPNRPPRMTGYQASNQLTVTVRDLARVGAVADAAVAAGAGTIGQISFGIADPVAPENSARLAAVKALEDKAALYAQAVGYRIVRLVSLSEGETFSPGPRPVPMMAMRAAVAEATPVEPGEMKVKIEVSGPFELAR